MIIEELRAATAQKHQQLDDAMMPVFQNATNKEKYISLLKKFYGSFKPLYSQVENYIGIDEIPDFSERRSIKNLENDLLYFGIDTETIATMQEIPEISSKAEAMGTLYVLEGSTMGGVYLAKMLQKQLDINENTGLSFFTGYGKETKSKWQKFIHSLEQFASPCNCHPQITATAAKTFDSIRDFMTAK